MYCAECEERRRCRQEARTFDAFLPSLTASGTALSESALDFISGPAAAVQFYTHVRVRRKRGGQLAMGWGLEF